MTGKAQQPTLLSDIFKQYKPGGDAGGHISREFQDYGYRLAVDLDDLAHKALYIKMAKEVPRAVLEAARAFVVDADHAKSRARLFMWKVNQLRKSKLK